MPLLMSSHAPIIYSVTVLVHESVALLVAFHVHVSSPALLRQEGIPLFRPG
jgi:hypothetical protein